MRRTAIIVLATAGLWLGMQAETQAGFTTIMDQIGTTPAPTGSGYWNSETYPGNSGFNQTLIDDFSVSGAPAQLAEVDAEVRGYGSFAGFNTVSSWHVAIYSSLTAAENSGTALTGDIFDYIATPAQVTLTTPYGPDTTSAALVQISINKTLAAGSYYIGVTAELSNGAPGQMAVYSRYDFGTPGGFNDIQVNPGQGYGYLAASRGGNATYRILAQSQAVPEPSSLVALSTGLLLFVFRRVRRARTSPA